MRTCPKKKTKIRTIAIIKQFYVDNTRKKVDHSIPEQCVLAVVAYIISHLHNPCTLNETNGTCKK